MRLSFTFFLLIFILLMGYIFFRGYQNFVHYPILKWVYTALYVLLFATMLTGFIAGDSLPSKLSGNVSFIGFTFLILAIYMGLAFLVIDVFRLADYWFIHADAARVQSCRMWANAASFGLVVVVLIIGNYRFNHPDITTLALSSEHPSHNKHLKIVMVSDLHFGNNIRKNKVQHYVRLINEQSPDIVFVVGDISDRNIEPFIQQKMDEDLRQIRTKYGVYGVPGNHEHYAENRLLNYHYYELSGIRMLLDTNILIDNSFYVAGRDDRTNPHRKPLSEIIKNSDPKYPIFLLDHQPYALEEAEQNGIAMQFSGHTHNGQFFPGNLIVKAIYELGFGYKKKGRTHYYVSSGLGIWGPLYRIGTKSELVVVNFSYYVR